MKISCVYVILILQMSHTELGGSRTLTMNRRPPQNNQDQLTATNALILVNVLIFLVTSEYPHLKDKYMKVNFRVSMGETYRLLTSTFLHSDFQHLALNCFSLYNSGPVVRSCIRA